MLTLTFSTPFTRAQLRTQVTPLAAAFPTLTFQFSGGSELHNYDAVVDADDDPIIGLKVDGFTTLQEVGTFINALPVVANNRITETVFKP